MLRRRSRVLVILLLFACTLIACKDTTRVGLAIERDPALPIERYLVVVEGTFASAAALPALELLIDDELAGREVVVDVYGVQGGIQIAYGTATVTPKLHGRVDVAVLLAAVSCGAWCEPGATACAPQGITSCVRGPRGCMEWATPMTCPADAPFCSNGSCAATCSDECQPGATICDSVVAERHCGQFDGDPCLDWSAPKACTGGTCDDDSCQSACSGSDCMMMPDAGVDTAPDAGTCTATPCTLIPQCGCSAGNACDVIPGSDSTTCRTASPLGTAQTNCIDDTQCAAGWTCVLRYSGSGSCRKYCTADADCGTYGTCIDRDLDDDLLYPNLCTADCDPTHPSNGGCPSGMKCGLVNIRHLGVWKDAFQCIDTQGSPVGTRCTDTVGDPDPVEYKCGQGTACLAHGYWDHYCDRLCDVNAPGTTCTVLGKVCTPFSTPFVVRGREIGACRTP